MSVTNIEGNVTFKHTYISIFVKITTMNKKKISKNSKWPNFHLLSYGEQNFLFVSRRFVAKSKWKKIWYKNRKRSFR